MIRLVSCAVLALLAACAPGATSAAPVCAASSGKADAPIVFRGREMRFAAQIAEDAQRLSSVKLATIGLGDSIMQRWPNDVLGRIFGGPALSAGIGGYTVGQVLGRLDNTDWRGQRPKTVVLMIGTNDLARGASACDIVAGIEAIRARVARIFPGAKFTVMSVLPRGARLDEFAPAIAQINETLRTRSRAEGFTFVDANAIFKKACPATPQSGTCEFLQGPKNVHPTPTGYQMLAKALGH